MERVLAPLVLALLLAGCTTAPPAVGPHEADATMSIQGIVQDASFAPLAGVLVEVVGTSHATTTEEKGSFAFAGLARTAHVLRASAPGVGEAMQRIEPEAQADVVLIVHAPDPDAGAPAVVRFRGYLQCAAEALIISGPCDVLLTYAGQDAVLEGTNAFQLAAPDGWATLAGHLAFPAGHPGMDGMRVTVRAHGAANDTASYEQYGRFHGAKPFDFRLEPGGTYDDGTGPVPSDATAFQFEVYPHSHGYHAACVPETPVYPATCPLGVGGGVAVEFELLVAIATSPLPPDWSPADA